MKSHHALAGEAKSRLERSCGSLPSDWLGHAPSEPGIERIDEEVDRALDVLGMTRGGVRK